MANVSVSTLKTKIRFRAEQENDEYINDTNLLLMINDSWAALREIINNQDQNTYITSADVDADGTDLLPLPSDLLEVKGVDIVQGTQAITLESFNFQERNHFRSPFFYITGTFNRSVYRWRSHGDYLLISPTPPSGEHFRIWYMPVHTQLTNDSDTINFQNHWDEWVILDVAIKCFKKEADPMAQELMQDKAIVEDRIKSAAGRRNAAMAETMVNVEDLHNDIYPFNKYW